MPWTSKTMYARFDFVTPLDAAAVGVVQTYLGRLILDIEGLCEYQVRSLRRLARGQVRVDIEFRLGGDNRETVKRAGLRDVLTSLVGSAKYITPQGRLTPLIRLYRTRLLS